MPFKSKAQAKMMFATNPEKAKEWAKETNMKSLPEKKHPQTNPDRKPLHTKISGEGMFHKNAFASPKGQFFNDMPGRSDGTFYEKNANEIEGYPEQDANGDDINGSAGGGGEEMGGGMYGTGEGGVAAKVSRRPSLKSMFNIAGPGRSRPAVKVAGESTVEAVKAYEGRNPGSTAGWKVAGKEITPSVAKTPAGPPASAKPIDPYSAPHKKPAGKTPATTVSKPAAPPGPPLDPKYRLPRGEPGSPHDAVASSANATVDQIQSPAYSPNGPVPRATFGTAQDMVAGAANQRFNALAHTKKGAAAPSDWEADMGIATGFHRPTKEQPEPLESGGERFHSSLAKPPASGSNASAAGIRHGIREGGSLSLPPSATTNLGKHAGEKAAFDLDSEGAKNYAKDRWEEAKSSLSSGASDLAGKADEAVRGITRSPVGTGIAALVGLKMLGRGGRGVARGAGKLFGRRKPPPPSLLGGVAGGLRRLVGGK